MIAKKKIRFVLVPSCNFKNDSILMDHRSHSKAGGKVRRPMP